MGTLLKNPEVVCTELQDGAVLLHLGTRSYYSLNSAGLTIWRLIDVSPDVEGIAARLSGAFEKSTEPRSVVSDFLEQLLSQDLVVSEEGDGDRSGAPLHRSVLQDGTEFPLDTLPELIKHDEPLHEVPLNPFDPQLPLAE